MGRQRTKRTAEEWRSHGHQLLNIIGKKHKLYNDIELLITKLNNNNIDENEAVNILNSYNDKLKEHWIKWTQKIKQTSKDKERTKFYIKKTTYENILRFICLTPEDKKAKKISDNKVFEILFSHINSYGINNIKEMHDLISELEKFDAAISERHSKDKITSDENAYKGRTNKIIHAILSELIKNKITSFDKLIKIRKVINRELEEKNKILTRKNKFLKSIIDIESKD